MKNNNYLILLFLASLLLFSACSSTRKLNSKQTETHADIKFCNPIQPIETFDINEQSDTVIFENIEIVDACLQIKISYSGGCGDIEMSLFYEEINSEEGTYVFLKPVFTDRDPCRSFSIGQFSFDLKPFESRARAGGFVFKIENYDKPVFYALPLH